MRTAAEAAEYKAHFSGLRAEVAETARVSFPWLVCSPLSPLVQPTLDQRTSAQAHEREVKRLKAQKDNAHKRLEEAESDVRKVKVDTSKQLQVLRLLVAGFFTRCVALRPPDLCRDGPASPSPGHGQEAHQCNA